MTNDLGPFKVMADRDYRLKGDHATSEYSLDRQVNYKQLNGETSLIILKKI